MSKKNPKLASKARPDKIKYPLHQTILSFIYRLVILFFASVGYFRVVAYLISIPVSLILSGVILGFLFLSRPVLTKHPINWAKSNQVEKVRSLPLELKAWLVVALVALWIPHGIARLYPSPEVIASIASKEVGYVSGLDVGGVKWQDGFAEYELKIENKSSEFEIIDLRIDLRVPGGLVKHELVSSNGAEDVNYSLAGLKEAAWVNRQKITETIKAYGSNGLITAVRLFPRASFTSKLIIKPMTMRGGISISYYYSDFWGRRVHEFNVYPIISKDSKEKALYVDMSKHLAKVPDDSALIFDQPVQMRDLHDKPQGFVIR